MLFVKITEKHISPGVLNAIICNWKSSNAEFTKYEVLDSVNRYEIKLRVPFKWKGEKSHMTVSSKLFWIVQKDKCVITMYCNLVTPVILSFLIGSLIVLMTTSAGVNVVFGIIFGLLFSTVFFFVLRDLIQKASIEYLDLLCLKYFDD